MKLNLLQYCRAGRTKTIAAPHTNVVLLKAQIEYENRRLELNSPVVSPNNLEKETVKTFLSEMKILSDHCEYW